MTNADIIIRGSDNLRNNGIGRVRNYDNANGYRDRCANFEAMLVIQAIVMQ